MFSQNDKGEKYLQFKEHFLIMMCFTNQKYTDIQFKYKCADGDASLARRLYAERYPTRRKLDD